MKMPRVRLLVSATTVALTLGAGAAASAAASAGEAVQIPQGLHQIDVSHEQFKADQIDSVQKAKGVSAQEAEDIIVSSTKSTKALQAFQERFPDSFAWSEQSSENTPIVHVVGPVTSEMTAFVSGNDISTQIVGGARLSKADALSLNRLVHDSFFSVSGYLSARTAYAPQTNTLNLSFRTKEGVPGSQIMNLGRAALDSNPAVQAALKASGTQLSIVEDDTLSAGASLISGGTALGQGSSRNLACTAAFTVTQGSARGLLTAGHCIDNMNYEGNPNTLYFKAEMYRGYGDAQWHSSGDSLRPYFIYNRSGSTLYTTAVTGVSDPFNQNTYSMYGSATAHMVSSTVVATGVTATYTNVNTTYYNLAETNSDVSNFGDSGGPWFTGVQYAMAVGIQSGKGTNRTWFTSVPEAERRLNVQILIQPR